MTDAIVNSPCSQTRARGRHRSGAFTLVEILGVVVVLGILASVVVPGLAKAGQEASISATSAELQRARQFIEVFRARNSGRLPAIQEGDGQWGELVGERYLSSPPTNQHVDREFSQVVRFGLGPEATPRPEYGWIYNPLTGGLWAGGFDERDQPIPR